MNIWKRITEKIKKIKKTKQVQKAGNDSTCIQVGRDYIQDRKDKGEK